jgi:hypothetical protein
MSQRSSHGMKNAANEPSHSVKKEIGPEGEAAPPSLHDWNGGDQVDESGASAQEVPSSAGPQSENMEGGSELPNDGASSSILVGHVAGSGSTTQTEPPGSEIQEDDGRTVPENPAALNEVEDHRAQSTGQPAEALPSAIGSNEGANAARYVSFAMSEDMGRYVPSPDYAMEMRENNIFASTTMAGDGQGWRSRRSSLEHDEMMEQSLAEVNKSIAQTCARSMHAAARYGDLSNLLALLSSTTLVDAKVRRGFSWFPLEHLIIHPCFASMHVCFYARGRDMHLARMLACLNSFKGITIIWCKEHPCAATTSVQHASSFPSAC